MYTTKHSLIFEHIELTTTLSSSTMSNNNNIFWKNFQLCNFFNFKCLPTIQSYAPPPPPPPHDQDQDHNNHSSSISATSLLINNINSLYRHDFTTTSHSTFKSDDFFSSSDESDSDQSPPDFAAVFASQRFFFSSPGPSNSIVESPDIKPGDYSQTTKNMDVDSAGGVRVPKYSINPYDDFRRSMQEMMEARDVLVDGRSDLDYLHELLLCYLALNPKHTHKFIISAFTDLLITLLSASSSSGTRHHRRQDNVLRRVV